MRNEQSRSLLVKRITTKLVTSIPTTRSRAPLPVLAITPRSCRHKRNSWQAPILQTQAQFRPTQFQQESHQFLWMLLVLQVVPLQQSPADWVVAYRHPFPPRRVKCCLFSSVVLPARMRWVGTVVVPDLRREWVVAEHPTYVEVFL